MSLRGTILVLLALTTLACGPRPLVLLDIEGFDQVHIAPSARPIDGDDCGTPIHPALLAYLLDLPELPLRGGRLGEDLTTAATALALRLVTPLNDMLTRDCGARIHAYHRDASALELTLAVSRKARVLYVTAGTARVQSAPLVIDLLDLPAAFEPIVALDVATVRRLVRLAE